MYSLWQKRDIKRSTDVKMYFFNYWCITGNKISLKDYLFNLYRRIYYSKEILNHNNDYATKEKAVTHQHFFMNTCTDNEKFIDV